jgi:rhodanese-related sulfurtransferase
MRTVMKKRIVGMATMVVIGLLVAAGSLSAQEAASADAVATASETEIARTMQVGELLARIDEGSQPLILDVRTPEEYAEGHIEGAINIPYTELEDRVGELGIELGDEMVVYCRSGRRAGVAETALFELGYTNLKDLEGHINKWNEVGYPLVTP